MEEIKTQLKGIFPDIINQKLIDYLIMTIITRSVPLGERHSKAEFDLPKLSPNSCNYLHYQVYPFEQCQDESKYHFGIEESDCTEVIGDPGKNYSEKILFANPNDFPNLEYFHYEYKYRWNGKILYWKQHQQ